MSDALARWKRQVARLKQETLALSLAYRDPRVPWYAKVFAAGVVAYAFSPLDLIPDFIPVLGYLDDAMMVDVAHREVEPEFEAYQDYRSFRDKEIRRRAGSPEAAEPDSRAEWLDARRQELHERMRTRRHRLFGR